LRLILLAALFHQIQDRLWPPNDSESLRWWWRDGSGYGRVCVVLVGGTTGEHERCDYENGYSSYKSIHLDSSPTVQSFISSLNFECGKY
jgi:hypothetical protein